MDDSHRPSPEPQPPDESGPEGQPGTGDAAQASGQPGQQRPADDAAKDDEPDEYGSDEIEVVGEPIADEPAHGPPAPATPVADEAGEEDQPAAGAQEEEPAEYELKATDPAHEADIVLTPEPEPAAPAEADGPSGDLNVIESLGKAWTLMIQNAMLVMGGSVIVVTGMIGPAVITLSGPLVVGHLRAILKLANGEEAQLGDLFSGFRDYKRAVMTAILVLAIVACAWCVLTVVSWLLYLVLWRWLAIFTTVCASAAVGVVLASLLYFVMPVAAFSDAKPVAALKASVTFALDHLMPVMLFGAVTGVIAFAGLLVCGVGWVLTFPLATVLQVVAYREYYLPNAATATKASAEPDRAPDSPDAPAQ